MVAGSAETEPVVALQTSVTPINVSRLSLVHLSYSFAVRGDVEMGGVVGGAEH
jgi:hypothetical protein